MTATDALRAVSPDTVTDPVCGALIKSAAAAQVYTFRGQTWYFDSAECFRKFIEDPDKYLAPVED